MYIIEMHHKHRAFAQIILEKHDHGKTYEQLAEHRVIINHSGDVDEKYCRWCQKQKEKK